MSLRWQTFWWACSINLLILILTLHTYYASGSLVAAASVLFVLFSGSALILDTMTRRLLGPLFPLEMLHLPRWWRVITAVMSPTSAVVMLGDMDAKYLLNGQARAMRLLRRAGYEVPHAVALPTVEATPPTGGADGGRRLRDFALGRAVV